MAAFRSQVENDPKLFELSNFAVVENFIRGLPGVSMDVQSLPWTDLSDYRGGLGTAALAVAFVNPIAGIAMDIGSLFFSSKSKDQFPIPKFEFQSVRRSLELRQ